ncbi:hypothetical protein KKF55_01605 [Patescibacteria group bacterium]|nr:hypothetical protein [Patescibacteria group bacterium]
MNNHKLAAAPETTEHGISQPERRNATYDIYSQYYERYRLRLKSMLEAAGKPHNHEIIPDLLTIEEINSAAEPLHVYDSAHVDDLHPESELTFRMSADPLVLPEQVELQRYGDALSAYYAACKKIYDALDDDHHWKKYLDHSKPDWMLEHAGKEDRDHIFLRPDFILTEDQPVVTEIETSPFGLGLSYFLDKAYKKAGKPTSADESQLLDLLKEAAGDSICFVVTDYTDQYRGQFVYLAQELESKMGMRAVVVNPDEVQVSGNQCIANNEHFSSIYRAFYLHQTVDDPQLRKIALFDRAIPPCKPQLEEKALMGILWEPEFQDMLNTELGEDTFATLKAIIPRTWVVDKERIPKELGISCWGDLANLSRKQRQFILKTSGFSADGSWAKGVVFLEKLSKDKCRDTMEGAAIADGLYVLQEFKRGAKFRHKYFDFHESEMKEMNGRVRLTPYYSVANGKMITAKATMRENTDLIHGSVDSINVPVIESHS